MLGRAPLNVPALGTQVEVEGSKRLCKAWPRGVDLLVEPTSVLDGRSPSPSSTLSSSVTASSDSGVQGSSETGGAVAVSERGHESSEGQLVDCTSLLDGRNEDGSAWGLESVDDGGAGKEMVGSWKANPSSMQRGWERGQDGPCSQYVEESRGLIKEGFAGHLACRNEGSSLTSGLVQAVGMASPGKEGVQRRESCRSVSSGMVVPPRMAMAFKVEAAGDERLEARVLPRRKREHEDSLGEVVQRLCSGGGDGGQKVEAEDWLSDWAEFGGSAAIGSAAEEKAPPPPQFEDLEDILNVSAGGAPAEFWPAEMERKARNEGLQSPLFPGNVQLDLFEAVQAGLLYRGGSSAAATGTSPSPRSVNISPSVQVLPCSFSAPFNQPAPSLLPSQSHSVAEAGPRRPALLPEFFGGKPPPPAPPLPLLNAAFSPAPPHFPSPVQPQDFTFPLPASLKKAAQAPQGSFFSFSRPDLRAPKMAESVDQKLWQQLRASQGDAPSKLIAEAPHSHLKPEPAGWRRTDWLGGELIRGVHRSPHLPSQAELAPLRQVIRPEHVGRCVRLEDLFLAERLLCAASEAVQLGDLTSAQAILARLNQQSSPPTGQQQQQQQLLPARRVALLFGDALSKRIAAASSSSAHLLQHPLWNSTLELINQISAFKQFCEISPISQFSHFIANQAILDAVEGENFVHIVDFELGFGGQWASFLQEISQQSHGPAELKITTMGTDTLERRLVKENLLQFAKEVGIKLEVNFVTGHKVEGLKALMTDKREKEAIAINFGFGMNRLMSEFSFSTEEVLGFLQALKGLCPKVVAVVDCECEFEGPSAYMDAMQFYSCVFESLEASSKLSTEIVQKIENLVFGPKIRDLVNSRWPCKGTSENGLPPWRILLQKVGFTALPFSIAAESQATWLVKNPLNSGFTFFKQHATLLLAWYCKNLISTSAWV